MGRKKISEQCYALAMKHLPNGFTYQFRKHLSGRCWRGKKHISAPKPLTRRALHVWLHECHHCTHVYSKFPSYYAEYQCEMFATRTMEAAGIKVHEKSIESAKSYVRKRVEQNVRSGLAANRISPEIAEWCGWGLAKEVTNNLPITPEIKERLKKCLALATSDNEHEASLAMGKAREIMTRYNLRTADLVEGTFTIEQRIIRGATKSVQQWEVLLASNITRAFDGALLYQKTGDGWKMFFMAARTDLEIICDLFLRIRPMITTMSKEYVAEIRQRQVPGRRMAPKTMHNSYRHGVVNTVKRRLNALQEATRPEQIMIPDGFGCGTDLIEVKTDAVKEFQNKEHPRVSKSTGSLARIDGSAYDRGRKDGNSINLHRSISGGGAPLAIGVSG